MNAELLPTRCSAFLYLKAVVKCRLGVTKVMSIVHISTPASGYCTLQCMYCLVPGPKTMPAVVAT